MIRKTRNRILKILLVLFALCLHLAVLYVAIKAVKRFLNTTFTVSYQMTYQTTMAGELVQEVKRFGSTTAVTAVPDLGYEFVEWSDGVKTPTREDKFVIKSFAVYPICKVAVLDAPVICISTEERASVESREEYVNCSISVIDTDESYSITEAPAQIRGRGNGSWWYDKKSYKIKFEEKTSVLGSDYKAKSWSLIATHSDKTLSRNAAAFDLSERMENIEYTSVCECVEVFLNDEYIGVYSLCDAIETGDGRVDISGEDDGSNPGFLIEIEQRAADSGTENIDYFVFDELSYEIKTPDLSSYIASGEEEVTYNTEFTSYITSFFSECYEALDGGDYGAVTELIDVDSFAETYIIHEVFGVIDSGYASFYLYRKAGGGKLISGPIWDFDSSGGNFNYLYATEAECSPEIPLIAEIHNVWYNKLLKFDEFNKLVKEKLIYYKNAIFEMLGLLETDNPDGIYAAYGRSLERNFEKWQTLGVFVYDEPESVYSITTVAGQFDYLRNWLTERYYYVCTQYGAEQ